jgi:hypothetical protein
MCECVSVQRQGACVVGDILASVDGRPVAGMDVGKVSQVYCVCACTGPELALRQNLDCILWTLLHSCMYVSLYFQNLLQQVGISITFVLVHIHTYIHTL